MYIKLNNLSCVLLSTNYKSCRREKLNFKCKCGSIYNLSLNTFIQSKQFQCRKCGLKRGRELHKNSDEKIINIILNNGYKPIYGKIQSSNNIHIMDSDGYMYNTTIYAIKDRTDKSSKFNKNNPYRMKNIDNYISNNNLKISIVEYNERFDSKKDKITVMCSCGNLYKSTWGGIISENRIRCEKCTKSQSLLSIIVENYLSKVKINFIKEKRFDACKNINPLPFDFYLCDYNCCIEVQGIQHYCENNFFNQSLAERQRIDCIKKDYCLNNNIGYLAIPYWDIKKSNKEIDNYKELINNILS